MYLTDDDDPLELGGFKCPPGARLEMSQARRVKITGVDGRDGSVIETSGLDSWRVTITFEVMSPVYNILNQALEAGADKVGVRSILAQLEDLKERWLKGKIKVSHSKLAAHGINYLALMEYQLSDPESLYCHPVCFRAVQDDEKDLDDPGEDRKEAAV